MATHRKKILIAGGTGLVGSRLMQMIDASQYDIHILTRKKRPSKGNISYFEWDFKSMSIDDEAVQVDYIINLTGAGIADKRWTNARKKVLIDSRVNAAALIKAALERSQHKVDAYISASAIGIYGDRADEKLTEESKISGDDFMVDCCVQWEDAADTLVPFTNRLIKNRIGIVLSTHGGALPKILMTKMVGVYNYFGSGKQYYSWIHIDDICKVFIRQMEDSNAKGIYNVVSPKPLTNKQFTIDIKNGLGGIAALPAPVFGLRLALGEMANVVLNSNRVFPERLLSEGFEFEFDDVGVAVKDLVKDKI